MNPGKIFASLAGMIMLAGLSYHQVRDKGHVAVDESMLTGTAIRAAASSGQDPATDGPGNLAANDCPLTTPESDQESGCEHPVGEATESGQADLADKG